MTATSTDRPPTRCVVCRRTTAGTRTCPPCDRAQPELPFEDTTPTRRPARRPRRLRVVPPEQED